MDQDIRKLTAKIARLEREIRRNPKPYIEQPRVFNTIKRKIANVKAGDLGNRQINIYDDDGQNTTVGLTFSYNGKVYKLEAMEVI